MKAEMKGFVVNAVTKVDASSELVNRVVLEVQGDMATILPLMKMPLGITLEVLQTSFGEILPQRAGGRAKKSGRD